MASQFVGLHVRIQVPNGLVVEGRVRDVEPATQQLSLSSAVLTIGGVRQQLDAFSVAGKDILDLAIIPGQESLPPAQQTSAPPPVRVPQLLIPPHLVQYQPSTVRPPVPRAPLANAAATAAVLRDPSILMYAPPVIPVEPPKMSRRTSSWQSAKAAAASTSRKQRERAHAGAGAAGGGGGPAAPDSPPPPPPPVPMLPIPGAPLAVSASQPHLEDAIATIDFADLTLDTPRSRSATGSTAGSHRLHRSRSPSARQRRAVEASATTRRKQSRAAKASSRRGSRSINGLSRGVGGGGGGGGSGAGASYHHQSPHARQRFATAALGAGASGSSRASLASAAANAETFGELDHEDVSKDFDFQASLSHFDKRRIFEELRQMDSTSPEARLVSHNRRQDELPPPVPAALLGRNGANGSGEAPAAGHKHERSHHHHQQHLEHQLLHQQYQQHLQQQQQERSAGYNPQQQKLSHRQNVLDFTSGDETGNDAEVEESELESDAPSRYYGFGSPPVSAPRGAGFGGAASDVRGSSLRMALTPTVGASIRGAGAAAAGIGSASPSGRIDKLLSDTVGRRVPRDGVPDGPGGVRSHFETINGVYVPTATPAEMFEIERIAASETGPNDEQMVENGGRSAAMIVLQALGGSRRIKPGNHNDKPFVVVLVGNNKTGAYGLVAARHLANHECRVLVCTVGQDAELANIIAYQQKIFLPTGGTLVRSHEYLPDVITEPVDAIIDALLGSHQTLLDLATELDRSAVSEMILWANASRAPTLSIDMPSGINPTTGYPISPTHFIQPRWTVAMGLPKTGHLRSQDFHGILFLADIGIPRIVFQRMARLGAVLLQTPMPVAATPLAASAAGSATASTPSAAALGMVAAQSPAMPSAAGAHRSGSVAATPTPGASASAAGSATTPSASAHQHSTKQILIQALTDLPTPQPPQQQPQQQQPPPAPPAPQQQPPQFAVRHYVPPFGDRYLVGLVCINNASGLGDGDD
nr:enhancer of mRNA decapping [Polyrhizophydium stewartii]